MHLYSRRALDDEKTNSATDPLNLQDKGARRGWISNDDVTAEGVQEVSACGMGRSLDNILCNRMFYILLQKKATPDRLCVSVSQAEFSFLILRAEYGKVIRFRDLVLLGG